MVSIAIYEDPLVSEPAEVLSQSPEFVFLDWVLAHGFSISESLPFMVRLNGEVWPVSDWGEFLPLGSEISVTRRMFGVELLIGAVLAVGSAYYVKKKVQIPDVAQSNVLDLPDKSPTYDASVQTNISRLGQPVPAGFGYQRIVPDLASAAHRRFVDGEQRLYHVLSIGHFEHTLHNPTIGDTPFSSFDRVRHKYYKAGEKVDLFPTDVYTNPEVDGINLYAPNDPDYSGYSPEFLVCPSGDGITRVEYDFIINGLYLQDKKTGDLGQASVTIEVSYQKVDDDDLPVGGWVIVGTHTFSDDTQNTLRFTKGFDIRQRGKLRMRRSSDSVLPGSSRLRDTVDWVGLKAFLDTDQIYNHAVWAVEIPVTNQIGSGAQNKIKVERQTLLPVWSESSGWSSPVATRNPIWGLCAIAKASFGGNKTDKDLSLEVLKSHALAADSRGDYFDYEFDTKTTVKKAMSLAARACRSEFVTYGNRLSVVRDEYRELAQMQFGLRQIERESFSLIYPKDDKGDKYDSSVEVEYIDDKTWESVKVICSVPGDTATRPYPWKFEGCTNAKQAMREGMFLAARRKYRNRISSFKTEMDGQLARKGMSIGLSFAISGWGQSGDIIDAVDASDGGKIITLREPVEFIEGEAHQIVLRGVNGRPQGPYFVKVPDRLAVGGYAKFSQYLHLLPDVKKGSPDIYTGFKWDKTSYHFGVAEKYEKRYIVRDHLHQGDYSYKITAEFDDPRVYQFDDLVNSGEIPLPEPYSPFSKALAKVSGFSVEFTGSAAKPVVHLLWAGVDLADRYVIQSSRNNGASWQTLATVSDLFYRSVFDASVNKLRIAAMGEVIGPWLYKTVSLTAGDLDRLRPNKVEGLALASNFVGDSCHLKWSGQPGINQWRISVCSLDGVVKRTVGATNPSYSYSANDAKIDGLGRSLLFKVWAVGVDGDASFDAATLRVKNPQIGTLGSVSVDTIISQVVIEVDRPSASDFLGIRVWRGTSPNFSVSDSNIVVSASADSLIALPIPDDLETSYIRVAGVDVWGDDELVVSPSYKVTRRQIEKTDIKPESIETPHLAANSVTAGKILIDKLSALSSKIGTIISGYIRSADGHSFWNLDSGAAHFNNVTVVGHVNATSGTFRGRLEASSGFFNGQLRAVTGVFLDTIHVKGNALSVVSTASGTHTVSVTITVPPEASYQPVICFVSTVSNIVGASGYSSYSTRRRVRIYRNGSHRKVYNDTTTFPQRYHEMTTAFTFTDRPGAGTHTYLVKVQSNSGGAAGHASTELTCFLGKR